MTWRNIQLIWQREVRDQLRDRRTLFTIAVLPLLLYPLLGMVTLQVGQFLREHPNKIAIVGATHLPSDPALVEFTPNEGDSPKPGRFTSPFVEDAVSRLLELTDFRPSGVDPAADMEEIRGAVSSGKFDAVVIIPPNFRQRMDQFDAALKLGPGDTSPDELAANAPQPQVLYNAANDKSKIARERVNTVLEDWRKEIVRRNLAARRVPASATEPFKVQGTDVAPKAELRAAVWSKVLPFVALIWALTGAFYPAIDLCAGEKERGTLETLLSSPAQRSEIVCGKLLTVMCFSMATSILNLASMGFTGMFVVKHLQSLAPVGVNAAVGPPPLMAAGWLILALVPISAFFSGVAIAVASLARSTKEGQYYLMPILMISLPLMVLPILPSIRLDLGTSLIPVTGVMLLLRALIEHRYAEALPYVIPVFGVTILCVLFSVRWAIAQFNSESVLFPESERWDLGIWIRHLVRDREDTPSLGEAVLCGLLILVIRFLAGFVVPMPNDFSQFVVMQTITQIAFIATPALLMAIMLTRKPGKTLLLRWPNALAPGMAMLLAVCLHPSAMLVSQGVQALYPMPEDALKHVAGIATMLQTESLLAVLFVTAFLPAICEELAFRGFVLSGLRHMGRKWTAIAISSVLFGAAHGILQQSLSAAVVGMVIGYVAVQTGSLLPCILFHATHNSLGLILARLATGKEVTGVLSFSEESGFKYHPGYAVAASVAACAILAWFHFLPYQHTAEEKLQESIEHQPLPAPAR